MRSIVNVVALARTKGRQFFLPGVDEKKVAKVRMIDIVSAGMWSSSLSGAVGRFEVYTPPIRASSESLGQGNTVGIVSPEIVIAVDPVSSTNYAYINSWSFAQGSAYVGLSGGFIGSFMSASFGSLTFDALIDYDLVDYSLTEEIFANLRS